MKMVIKEEVAVVGGAEGWSAEGSYEELLLNQPACLQYVITD